MPYPDDSPGPDGSAGNADEDRLALERALKEVPRGAVALAGTAVILLMIAWLAIYVFEVLPRGSVG